MIPSIYGHISTQPISLDFYCQFLFIDIQFTFECKYIEENAKYYVMNLLKLKSGCLPCI